MADPTTSAATVRLSVDASAYTEALVRVMDEADERAGYLAFREGPGRVPESSPERTARMEALAASIKPRRYRREGERWVHIEEADDGT